MNLDLTKELEPTASQDDSTDFEVNWPLPDWDESYDSFQPSMNRYGAVYVRILCAQRLPCPVGSSVVAAASLPPYSGRVKTTRKSAYLSTYEHGVCVKWGPDERVCSMVNAWNNEESPIPTIHIALMFSPLGMGLLDFTMCSVELSCRSLMTAPGSWKSQWCQMILPDNMLGDTPTIPMVRIEAMFAPTSIDDKPTDLSVSTPIRKKKAVIASPQQEKRAFMSPVPTTIVGETSEEANDSDSVNRPPSLDCETMQEPENDTPDYLSEEKTTVDETSAHLLRVSSFWVPAACHVCSKILVGRNRGFSCEACKTVCCEDCRLNVDLELPCGSKEAQVKVEASMHSKLSMGNLMSIVAPDEIYAEQRKGTNVPLVIDTPGAAGIGRLMIEFKRASLFEESLAPDESPDVVFCDSHANREGEYYCRITSSFGQKTARTRAVYSGCPHFNSKELDMMVAHYGEEFRLDCIDARTDQIVGSALLSTQGILQMQRDDFISKYGASLFQCLKGPIVARGTCPPAKLILRKGINKAFGLDFYITSKDVVAEDRHDNSEEKGAICGWIEVSLGLEEFVHRLYHPRLPIECPDRPADDFNMALFQIHMMRAKAIFEDLNGLLHLYFYTVSWKNPVLTGCTLVVLVSLCIRFDTEFVGSLPVSFLAFALASTSLGLKKKGRKDPFIKREIEASRRAGNVSVNYIVHRPVGTISISVGGGRALVSRDLGIPGKVSCSIFFDPVRMASPEVRSKIMETDKAAESTHLVGTTQGVLSADPEWNETHFPSAENTRLRQLLRQADELYTTNGSEVSSPILYFPVLQPFEVKSRRRDESGRYLDGIVKGWETSVGAIVVRVQLAIGFDQILGEVVVPISQIINRREVKGWFQVLDTGTKNLAPVPDDSASGLPHIYVIMKWNPPEHLEGQEDAEREISYAVQEELVRSSQLSRQRQFDIVGTSIGAVNTALGIGGNIQFVQNTLGRVLDTAETFINLFNFTDPFKSSLIFMALVVLAVVLIFVPTRYIILAAVAGQYGSTFADRYNDTIFNSSRRTQTKKINNHSQSEERDPAFLEKWVTNMLKSLPTNEDLRRAYFWESRRLGSHEHEKFASQKRVERLERLWKARWHSTVEIRAIDDPTTKGGDDSPDYGWNSVFVVLEGRRLIFWQSVADFDSGELAKGLLSLSGHAGISTPSPIEMREIPVDCSNQTVTVFGKGDDGQQRMTIILPDEMAKKALEAAISEAISKDD